MQYEVSMDPAVQDMLQYASAKGWETAFDRAAALNACPIGHEGNCCSNCFMGPCRIVGRTATGICGATQETIQARNLIRHIAAGAGAHADHGRDIAFVLLGTALGHAQGFEIKDVAKLNRVAGYFGIATERRSKEEVARDVATAAIADFARQNGEITYIKRAPVPRQELWRRLGIAPRGIDREIVETLHRTNMGVDQDYEHILDHALRVSLADGWGGSMMATDLSDILFGLPKPVMGKANLAVLKKDEVNIVIHGHDPSLSEMILVATREPEAIAYARSKGANGINLVGMCCTANEILMRHGIPVAGNFAQQELAIMTGAVDAMVVDVQCVMESLVAAAEHVHTKVITTSPKARIRGAMHIQFSEEEALSVARLIVRTGIDNFPNRGEVHIPEQSSDLIAGFSHEYINYMQGGVYRESFRPLNDNIMNGRIRGAAGVVGCNNVRTTHDSAHMYLIRELIRNDVLVVTTGCGAIASGKYGCLSPEMMEEAGPGLREVCEAIGVPPVLHVGSCVDNSRILTILTQMAQEGGLGEDISDLPAVGLAPEWMSEKALAIGTYFVASGAHVIFGVESPVGGSWEITRYILEGWEEKTGGGLIFEPDVEKMLQLALHYIDLKRQALKLEEYQPTRYARSATYLPGDSLSPEVYRAGLYSLKEVGG